MAGITDRSPPRLARGFRADPRARGARARDRLLRGSLDSPITDTWRYPEMDTNHYDEWARKITSGDVLGREPLHPMHQWHLQIAGDYYKQHPEVAVAGYDELEREAKKVAARPIWTQWYGGTRLHQEPLYPYLLAAIYAVGGSPTWMFILQMCAGLLTVGLLMGVTRRVFGEPAAVVAGCIAASFPLLLHYEVTLLRTSFIAMFAMALWHAGLRLADADEGADADADPVRA